MYQPEGFEKTIENGSVSGPGPAPHHKKYVCRLQKSLYGLKQSASNWNLLLVAHLRASNFLPLISDSSLFISKEQNGPAWCVIGTHVDDIFPLFNESEQKTCTKICSKIYAKNWKLKILGEISVGPQNFY